MCSYSTAERSVLSTTAFKPQDNPEMLMFQSEVSVSFGLASTTQLAELLNAMPQTTAQSRL